MKRIIILQFEFLLLVLTAIFGTIAGSSETASVRPKYVTCRIRNQCIPIKWCLALRRSPNWETAGDTCGPGVYALRQVCCLGPTLRPSTARCGRSFVRNPLIPNDEEGISKEGAWPWMVNLALNGPTLPHRAFCSGFLIDKLHVLTAANCFMRETSGIYVRAGTTNTEEATPYEIIKIVTHPSFDKNDYDNDIAIVTLAEEIDLSSVVPICLPNEDIIQKNLTGLVATEAGWPLFSEHNVNLLRHLSHLTIKSNSECSAAYKEYSSGDIHQIITDNMLCAKLPGGYAEPCAALSGSPLMVKQGRYWFAVGIASFGICQNSNVPGGYTRISRYVDWIKSVLSDE